MLTMHDLLLIKQLNNNGKIIYCNFENNEYVFRLISSQEYSQIRTLTTSDDEFEDAVCQVAILYPEDTIFPQLPFAGLAKRFSERILDESMIFSDEKCINTFENYRESLNTFNEQCFLFVKAAFQEYSFEEIESWDYEKLMKMTARAEEVLRLRSGPGLEHYKIIYDKEQIGKKSPDITDEQLVANGIDPMFYHAADLKKKDTLVEYPIIIGTNWNRGDLIEGYRKQVLKRQHNRGKL